MDRGRYLYFRSDLFAKLLSEAQMILNLKKTAQLYSARLILCSLVMLTGCSLWPKGDGGGIPAASSLAVNLTFGAASTTPYQCVGSGTLELLLNGVRVSAQNFSFGGLSGSTAPACQAALTFSDLLPTTYVLREPTTGRSCAKNMVLGPNQVSIRLDAGWICN